jgi:hypothetical protein
VDEDLVEALIQVVHQTGGETKGELALFMNWRFSADQADSNFGRLGKTAPRVLLSLKQSIMRSRPNNRAI